jgi:hypothetical protein
MEDRSPEHGSNRSAGAGDVPSANENRHLALTAYRLYEGAPQMPLVAAPTRRAWMDETYSRAAYHCLPMVIANQAGWFILSAHSLTVRWSGADNLDALKIFYLSGDKPYPAVSVFGHGILTFQIPYLFRTPPGYNLLVRGPANCPKDGACPLEGLVETDWSAATFTMNWQITRANHTISFRRDEPIAMIVPQVRGSLERFRPAFDPIEADTETAKAYAQWARSRREFIGATRMLPSNTPRVWQDHYLRGTSADGTKALDHQRSLRLCPFPDASANGSRTQEPRQGRD